MTTDVPDLAPRAAAPSPQPRDNWSRRAVISLLLVVAAWAASCSSCRRAADVPLEVQREATVAFFTALAAIDTSQEVLAREKLDRVVAIVPQEPAGWANLGLLLLRQQEIDAAREQFARAATLAPDEAAIVRLQALAESREGNLDAATQLWRRAVDLDPANARAAYHLALELERQGGAAHEADAQRALEQLLGRDDNLAARLDYARLAAKRGDQPALQDALARLQDASASWPDAARERLAAVQSVAAGDPRAAATHVAFLRNVLAREPAFRQALSRLTTPLDAVGEPIRRFLVLPNPEPRPAPADTTLAFTVSPAPGWPADATWAGAVALDGEAGETVVALGADRVRTTPGSSVAHAAGADAVVSAADLDYDFRTDLIVAGRDGLTILRQTDDGAHFDDISVASGVAEQTRDGVRGVWPADVDLDGDLDLVVAPLTGDAFVLRNNGDRTFARQQPFGPCPDVRAFVWADLDADGVPDAVCLDGAGAVRVFLNLRGGAFETAALPAGPAAIVAIEAGDVRADGRGGVIGVTTAGALVTLSLASEGHSADAPGRWQWQELLRLAGVPTLTAGDVQLLTGDLDNNAAADVVLSTAAGTHVLLRNDDATLTPLDAAIPLVTRALADLDADGRLELVGVTTDGMVATGTSTGARTYHWQRLRPRAATATGDQRVNSFGVGGEVEVRTGLHVQTQRITSPIVHVGLGESTSSDVIRIIWPNGVLQSEFEATADATIRADQRLKGSCPWLFAWNGQEMAFVTDLIWRSPLGLRINAQATADVLATEDWVKVEGRQLVPKDGMYDIRITAELWETHFFDMVGIGVIDHPAGTEVFVDERFAVPTPDLSPVVTSPLQAFAHVRDDAGRDVADMVARRDDVHLDFAGRGAYQGVTRQHYVEVTLPDEAPRTGPLYLVAQGWVHPTDSSINVAISQGSQAPPRGLALEVADADGRFRTVREQLGFPSGKDKTILLEIGSVLPTEGPRRVRLSTNLEIFWDRLAWAVGRPDVPVQLRRLPLMQAELRYRGFSVTTRPEASRPERPRYAVEGVAPRWLDLEGFHTRFGDVRPLLGDVDDRYVIMNAGDELALRFAEAPAPPAGHVRDFIVIGDGWVKDGDYNTTFSRTVLPLPTHATGRYDQAPRGLEADPVYQQHHEDFATYHTRYVTPAARDALRTGRPHTQ